MKFVNCTNCMRNLSSCMFLQHFSLKSACQLVQTNNSHSSSKMNNIMIIDKYFSQVQGKHLMLYYFRFTQTTLLYQYIYHLRTIALLLELIKKFSLGTVWPFKNNIAIASIFVKKALRVFTLHDGVSAMFELPVMVCLNIHII